MSFKSATVTVLDRWGQQSRITLKKFGDALQVNDLGDFINGIEAHSDAKVIGASVTETIVKDASGFFADSTDKGKYDSVEQKAKYIFKDADTGSIVTFTVPAPKEADIDDDQQPKISAATAIKNLIAEVTGREASDLLYLGGGLKSDLPPSALRRKTKDTNV